jgi:uncharacterized membrane protein
MTDIGDGSRFEFGRVIGRTFNLIGRNFLMFAFLSLLLVGAPQFALVMMQSDGMQTVVSGGDPLALTLITVLVTMILSYVLMAMLTRASIDDLSRGKASLAAALRDGVRYFFPLLIVALLTTIGIGLGLMVLIAPGLYLAVRWIVATPAVVAEDLGPTAARGAAASSPKGGAGSSSRCSWSISCCRS